MSKFTNPSSIIIALLVIYRKIDRLEEGESQCETTDIYCDSCKHWESVAGGDTWCMRPNYPFKADKDFGCKAWEEKETDNEHDN
jgi:hypothetical protein